MARSLYHAIIGFMIYISASAVPHPKDVLETRSTTISQCTNSTFQTPQLLGAEILSVNAEPIYNFLVVDGENAFNTTIPVLCGVNVTYTHPGYNDTITIQHFLPATTEDWNRRFLGVGGGGFAAFQLGALYSAFGFAKGYAIAGTDAGHVSDALSSLTPAEWALLSPGNVNLNLWVDFATRSLDDLPKIAKQIIGDYYGSQPAFSYWTGCSNGGRQGMVSAERYPDNYDGILAAAPAINWTLLFSSLFNAQLVQHVEDYFLSSCELEAFSAASIKACDLIDGVIDGIIGSPGECHFDPHAIIGQALNCSDSPSTITSRSADVVARIWEGTRTANGSFLWYPYSTSYEMSATAQTITTSNGSRISDPSAFGATLGGSWYQYFVEKDPSFDVYSYNYSTFADATHRARQEWASIIDIADPNLSKFKETGGKLLTWHGSIDNLIPTEGMIDYYSKAKLLDADLQDYYRLFLAPGVGHCVPKSDGTGYFPQGDMLDVLSAWVERNEIPETLLGIDGVTGRQQPLCQWPKVAKWDGVNDASVASSYACADNY